MIKKYYPFILLIFLHLILLTQIKYTVWPEMVLYPYLMLHGFTLYKDIINPYFPLLNLVSAGFFQIFGLSILNLKILTWLIILITDLVILFVSTHFYKQKSKQLLTIATFILLQIYFGGNGLWFELLLSPFIILSLALVYFYPKSLKKILISAFLFGLAVLIKQNALLFLFPISLFLILQKKYKNLATFFLTIMLILGIGVLFIIHANLWNDFYLWAIKLPLSFSKQHGFVLLPALHQYPLILFPAVTLIPFLLNKKNKLQSKLFWIISFLIAFLFAFPRYENFHLQVLAGLSGLFIPQLPKKFLIIFLLGTLVLFGAFFMKNFHQPDRFIDSGMLDLAKKIKNYPSIYILNGSELSYYFVDKLPPKPWATNFPWYFESNNFEKTFINSLQLQKTEYIVIGDQIGGDKYALGNYIPAGLKNYIEYNYIQIEKYQSYSIWQAKSNFL